MKWNNSNFTEHYKTIKVEGFSPDKLINKCNQNAIQLRNLRMHSDLEMVVTITEKDFKKFKKLAKSAYKITVLKNGGYKHKATQMWKRKVTIIGVAIFIGFIYYQSLFIAEIQIDGYAKIGEPELRRVMSENGLYEGCSKDVDIGQLKVKVYETFDEVSWMSVEFVGRMAKVKIVEGEKKSPSTVPKGKPCNIVADKSGYIYRVIPLQGLRVPEDGTYVKKGQVLITGKVPLYNVAYGTDTADQTETYVHAAGTVQAKIPVRINFFAEKYERVKTKTGRKIWGISINGHNSAKAMNRFESAASSTKNLLTIIKPIPIKIDLTAVEEVKLSQRELKGKNLKKAVEAEIRQYVKENLPNKTQILNKSLNFTEEKNIINIGVTLETLQTIGKEREIRIDKSDKKQKKDNT